MQFQVRDLMITLIPKELDLGIFAEPCDAGSEVPPGPPPSPPPPPPGPDEIFKRPDMDVTELRALFQIALTKLGGPLSAEEMRPRTLEDVDVLEKNLTNALEEVRELRAKFG